LNKIAALVVIAFLITGTLTIALRGQIQTKTAQMVQGIQLVDELASIGPSSYSARFTENFSDPQLWNAVFTTSVNGTLSVSNQSATLYSYFSGDGAFQAAQIRHKVGVNVTESPILYMQFTTSQNSVGFGLRFQGTDSDYNNVSISATSSSVEHQRISVQPVAVQLNVESYANALGVNLKYLTEIILYVETGSAFVGSLVASVSSISFSSVTPTVYSPSLPGEFQYILIAIHDPKLDLSLDRVEFAFDITGSADLLYVPELMQATSGSVSPQYILSHGLEYNAKPTSTYEVATVASANGIPVDDLLFPTKDNLTVSIHALRGTIRSFALKDLTLFYSLQPTVSNQSIPVDAVRPSFDVYLALILFLPSMIFLFLHAVFYHRPTVTRKTIFAIAGLGLVPRLLIAPFTGGSDLSLWIFYSRVYFEQGIVNLSYYPVLPFVYGIFLIAMSPYYLLRYIGLSDAQFFVHANYMLESVFAKLPMILADLGIFLLLFRLFSGTRRTGKNLVYASAFLFNPFSIYISAAWGQTDSLMLFGMAAGLWLFEKESSVRAGVALAASALVKLFGFYVTLLLAASQVMRREYKHAILLATSSVAVLVLVTIPLANLNNLWASLFLRLAGASAASISQTSLLRAVVPQAELFASSSLLVVSLVAIAITFLFWKSNNKILSTLIMVAISIYVFEVGAEAQWFLWVVPLMIILGQRDSREGLVFLAVTFGIASFLVTSLHLQGLGLMVTGEQYWLTPLDLLPNGLKIFAAVTIAMFALILAFMFLPKKYFGSGPKALLFSGVTIVCVYSLSVAAFR